MERVRGKSLCESVLRGSTARRGERLRDVELFLRGAALAERGGALPGAGLAQRAQQRERGGRGARGDVLDDQLAHHCGDRRCVRICV